MTLYETWLASAYYRNGRTNERTWADYIPREQAIYEDIIGNKLTSLSGTVTELAEKYNVPKAYIAGFVDGINETQPEKIELETLTEDTQINLVIDLEKLYKQMVEYKADHLYSLPQWEDVFTREQLDEFAAASQQKACAAIEAGKFKDEIVPVEVKKKKETIVVDTDEGPRPGTTAEGIARLRPAFKKDGIVTAANASSINDGAAAIVVMSEEKAKELGVTPMATWVAGALGGVDPSIMGVGPVAATNKVMAKTGLSVDDMDLIEANEAFAAQSLAVAHDLKFDMDKVNVNGGAIALGHPVGASGCRILVTLLHEMQKRDAKKGLATLCIGGGMGCATIVERD